MDADERLESTHHLEDWQKHTLLFTVIGWLRNNHLPARGELDAAVSYFFRVILTDEERLEHEQNAKKQASEI